MILGAALLIVAIIAGAAFLILRLRDQLAARADALQRKEAHYRALLDHTASGFLLHEVLYDQRGRAVDSRILQVNPAYEEITGLSAHDLVGHRASQALPAAENHWRDVYARVIESGRADSYEYCSESSGRWFAVTVYVPRPREFAVILRDITDTKAQSSQIEQLADHDPLTGLPNRVLLADRLRQAILQAERRQELVAICYVDLDDFKPVNDRYGHVVGDALLVEVAERLKASLRAGDSVSRIGGDEFVLLLTDIAAPDLLESLLNRVLASVSLPYHVNGVTAVISASIGVTLFPNDSADPDVLLRHADHAMYAAKKSGRNRYHLFDPGHEKLARMQREMLDELQQALERGEFRLLFQPILHLRSERIVGVEALLRWQHPRRGLLGPAEFLPYVEETDLMVAIGDWVLDEALREARAWHALGAGLKVSVNVAARQLQEPDFLDRLRRYLAAPTPLPPQLLELEITESVALDDMLLVAGIIESCREIGIGFALDDFGTGYSSLSYLRHLPAGTLKIDQSFVRDVLDNGDNLAIIEAIVGLGAAFSSAVVAEGVESAAHGVLLLHVGCDLAQGAAIAPAMAAAQVLPWIAAFKPDPSWQALAGRAFAKEDFPLLLTEVEHRRWLGQIERALASGDQGVGMKGALLDRGRHHGFWNSGEGRLRYGMLAQFPAVEALHRQTHEAAAEVARLVEAGQRDEAQARLAELQAIQGHLIDELHHLQAAVAAHPAP
jgi:diguanylate cyclase (GGDEF)-like protein/PAS domain S-box-containing protein